MEDPQATQDLERKFEVYTFSQRWNPRDPYPQTSIEWIKEVCPSLPVRMPMPTPDEFVKAADMVKSLTEDQDKETRDLHTFQSID